MTCNGSAPKSMQKRPVSSFNLNFHSASLECTLETSQSLLTSFSLTAGQFVPDPLVSTGHLLGDPCFWAIPGLQNKVYSKQWTSQKLHGKLNTKTKSLCHLKVSPLSFSPSCMESGLGFSPACYVEMELFVNLDVTFAWKRFPLAKICEFGYPSFYATFSGMVSWRSG